MKILFIIEASFNPLTGGVQHTTYKLGKHFYENGMDVSYLSLTADGHIQSDYGTLYHVSKPGKAETPENREYIKKILRTVQPDIVINQHPYVSHIRNTIYDLKKETGYTILGCLRNSLFSFKDNISFKVGEKLNGYPLKLAQTKLGLKVIHTYHFIKHRRDLRRILDKHDYFILLAPPNQKELEYFVGNYKTEKVKAIPNSIPEVFEPGEKEKTLLYVGRLDVNQKRADLLAKIWDKLYDKLPDWRFIIVGDGPYKNKLDQEIKELNLPRIETVGRQNPHEYYEKASILVMSSAYEGFPNVLLEAQSHSVAPVIFDSYSAVSWVVKDRENALLVEPFNVDKMAEKVEYLAKNQHVLQEMSASSYTNAERFTVEKVGQIWFNFFGEIARNGT